MRRLFFFRIAAVMLTVSGIYNYATGATVAVDVNKWHQKISGFGTCSAWNGTLTESEGEQLFDTIKGAGLSLHRVMVERNGLTNDEINNTKLATSYGVKVWGTPWYCKNGVKLDGRDYDTLYENNMQEWADTLAAMANKMKNMGAPLFAISSGNEVDLGWTKFSAQALAKWVGKYMGPTLASKAPGTKVIGIETCNWCGFSGFERTFEADPDAWKYSSILATHMYGCSPTAYPQIQAAGKEFWQTEIYDTQTDVEDPGMGSALRVCKLIHEALTIANMSAWHFWWIKPCQNCYNGALWVQATNKPAKRLWIMGNWSRYVRPGFVRVEAPVEPTPGVKVTAFRDSALTKVVIVVFNNNTNNISQEFSISGTSPTKLTPCITDPTRDLVVQSSQDLSSSTFTYLLPAQSVTSLVVDLVAPQVSVSPSGRSAAANTSNIKVNCSKSLLEIEFTAPRNRVSVVNLYNLNGTVAKTLTLRTGTGGVYSRSIDLSGMPDGFYILKINTDDAVHLSKVLLTK